MDHIALDELAADLLTSAHSDPAGRSSRTIHGGREHPLRQTLVTLIGGQEMAEHESPGEATLQVLRGLVELHAGSEAWTGSAGDFVTIPPERHSLRAMTDSAVLLTVVVHPTDAEQ